MRDTLEGKTALVTGASRGIGRAVALALAERGAHLGVHYHRRRDDAEKTSSRIRESGRRSCAVQADLSVPGAAGALAAAVSEELGGVDILVNNAGITIPRNLDDLTEEDWDRVLNTNLKSAFLLTQAVLPHMRARKWGRIVNLSSVAAQLGGVVGPHYAASKAGMIGLAHGYAALLAVEGITVNAVAPALIETEMVTSNPRASADLIPVGRFGTVEETAEVVAMLAENGYITGQTVNVNGGWYMS